MKNQYFGDINDYHKYGLLRCHSSAGLRVGVNWMLTPDSPTGTDGMKLRYLEKAEQWRHHDPQLFDHLASAISDADRRVARASEFLSTSTFYDAHVPLDSSTRRYWFTASLETLADADLVFFDPDNGMETLSSPRGRTRSAKHTYWDEVHQTWERGKSVLLFQHFARVERTAHAGSLVEHASGLLSGSSISTYVTSNVLFLLATQPAHQKHAEFARQLVSTRWGDRFRISA